MEDITQQGHEGPGIEPGPPSAPLMQPPPDEQDDRLSFEQKILAEFRVTAFERFAAHPELRSVVVVLDYAGALNDAPIDKALWIGKDGPINNIAAVLGSLDNVIATLEPMFARAITLNRNLRDQATVLGTELIKRRKELDELTAAIAAAKNAATVQPSSDSGGGNLLPVDHWPEQVWVTRNGDVYTSYKGTRIGKAGKASLAYANYAVDATAGYVDGGTIWLRQEPKSPLPGAYVPKPPDAWPNHVFVSDQGTVYAQRFKSKLAHDYSTARLEEAGFEPGDRTNVPQHEAGRYWFRKTNPAKWPDRIWFTRNGHVREHEATSAATFAINWSITDLQASGYISDKEEQFDTGGWWHRNPPGAADPA